MVICRMECTHTLSFTCHCTTRGYYPLFCHRPIPRHTWARLHFHFSFQVSNSSFFFPSLGMFEKTLAFTRKIPWILNGIGFWFFFVRSRWCFVLSCLFCVAAKSEGGKGGRLIDKLPVPIQIQIAIANQALSFAVERVDSAHCQQPHPVWKVSWGQAT